jgi:hypothetical protein
MKRFLLIFSVFVSFALVFSGCTQNGASGPSAGGNGEPAGGPNVWLDWVDDFEDGDFKNMVEPYNSPWVPYTYGLNPDSISSFNVITGPGAFDVAPPEPGVVPDHTDTKVLSVTATLLPSNMETMHFKMAGAVTTLLPGGIDLMYSTLRFDAYSPDINQGAPVILFAVITDKYGRKCFAGSQLYPYPEYYYFDYYQFMTLPNENYDAEEVLENAISLAIGMVYIDESSIRLPPPEGASPPPEFIFDAPGQVTLTLIIDNVRFYFE